MDNGKRVSVWDFSLKHLINSTAKSKPVLTGGCVTIATACIAISLIRMPLEISKAHIKDERLQLLLSSKIKILKKIHKQLIIAADKDLEVFNSYRFLPKKLPKNEKEKLKDNALHNAIEVPLRAAQLIKEAFIHSKECLPLCKEGLISDLGAGSLLLYSSFKGLMLLLTGNINALPEKERGYYLKIKEREESEGNTHEEEIKKLLEQNASRIVT